MTPGHSVDLRERAVRQIEAGGSVRTVAAMFVVSASFVPSLTERRPGHRWISAVDP
jgi:hypothetical protein